MVVAVIVATLEIAVKLVAQMVVALSQKTAVNFKENQFQIHFGQLFINLRSKNGNYLCKQVFTFYFTQLFEKNKVN